MISCRSSSRKLVLGMCSCSHAQSTTSPGRSASFSEGQTSSQRLPPQGQSAWTIPRSAHPQRSTSNQTLCDRAARDTIGFHPLPQLAGESVNEFCLPRLRLDRGQRETPLPVIMIPDGDPLFGRSPSTIYGQIAKTEKKRRKTV
jgi:hypothetical protein